MSSTATRFKRLERLEHQMVSPEQWVCPGAVELAEMAGLHLDSWQQRLVSSTHPQLLANCSRQVGKSTAASVLAVWTALHRDNQLVLMVAPALRQSAEMMKSCLSLWRALGRPVRATQESVLSLSLANGSRLIALPGTEQTIRGYAGCNLLIFDESAFIPDSLYLACRPFLAVSGGRLVMLSTPHACRGVFWEAWKNRAQYDYYEVKAQDCTRISETFLEGEREAMGEWFFQAEYCCVFNENIGAAFRATDIDAIVSANVQPWDLSMTQQAPASPYSLLLPERMIYGN